MGGNRMDKRRAQRPLSPKQPHKPQAEAADPAGRTARANRRRRLPRWAFFAIIGVCAAVFVFSAVKLTTILVEYGKGRSEYNGISQYGPSQGGGTGDQAQPDGTADPSATANPDDPTQSAQPTAGPAVDFEALRAINPDIVGWVEVDGTSISYPIVQGKDNDRYIDYTFEGRRNGAGCIFLDYRANRDFTSENSTIYGHNMNDGSMFAGLTQFKKEDFFTKHKYVTLHTPEESYQLEIFSAYVSSGFLFNQPAFSDKEAYQKFLDTIIKRSRFKTDVPMTTDDHMLSLSTCTYETDDSRFVIHAKFPDE